MNTSDIVIIALVIIVVAVAAVRFVGTATGKRDCCSGDVKNPGAAKGKAFDEVEVTDTDPANYPHEAYLGVGGMSCERCVAAVTRALDSVDGTWAEVQLQGGTAHVRCKNPVDEAAYRAAVEAAGYRVVSFREK
ncbi:heavy-metal-associated domain-containing protein [Paratractidigestivibacter sp.]|uniref:heavy-metal-associated domain-containing protein n=1 Tax=Paratractidigestivibacter sp. TaxID=2847316 RepID=UPI002ABD4490|nr:heavy-metal-associated domain-containing protein [Paratractidigestivibacter sp.]